MVIYKKNECILMLFSDGTKQFFLNNYVPNKQI